MKKTIFQQFMFATSIILMFLFATTSCNEPSLIGADVIDTDRPDVLSTDTLTLFSSTVKDDSIQTYNGLNLSLTYLCGVLEDPIFGKSTSEINAELRVAGSAPDSLTFFQDISPTGTQLDSVVFVLEYDQDQFFGNDITQQDISISLLDESMDNLATYYSTDTFLVGDELLSGTINPSQFDSVTVIGDDTIRVPLMRLVLSKSQAQAIPLFSDILFKDASSFIYYKDDDALLGVLNGINIRVKNTTPTKDLMMAFKMSTSSVSGMFLHYHTPTDTSFYRFRFTSNAAQMMSFEHDFTGSPVEPFIDGIDDEVDGEEYLFVQGMQGVNGKIRIPYTSGLKNPIVNQAQLKLTIATMVPDDVTYYRDNPLEQIFLSKKNADDELTIIADLSTALAVGSISGVFGGNRVEKIENNMVISTYTMNISEHLQDVINGVETSDEIFISTNAKAQSANRSIIFGSGHPTYAPKLNVTYTINQ
ncbi:MAG: DUF4270 family protein [Saprospiraceae bacterium]